MYAEFLVCASVKHTNVNKLRLLSAVLWRNVLQLASVDRIGSVVASERYTRMESEPISTGT